MTQYPNILYFVITDTASNDFEFDADISDGQILVGRYLRGHDDSYETDNMNSQEYASYQVKEIPDYPLMVETNYIDSNKEYFAHHSFGYYVYSNIESAKRMSKIISDNIQENMKRTNKIRLSESYLHRVIKESVKGVINELNWKTYMNAAKKAYDSAENDDEEDRAWKFADAAEKAFNRDYGYIEPDDNLEYYGQKANQDVSGANFTPRGQYGVGMGSWTPLYAKMHSVRNIGRGETNNSMINPNSKMKPSNNTIDAYQRAEDELEKYAKGKYKYKKGKGWQNESIYHMRRTIRLTENDLHRIVKESVNRILNEIGDTKKRR